MEGLRSAVISGSMYLSLCKSLHSLWNISSDSDSLGDASLCVAGHAVPSPPAPGGLVHVHVWTPVPPGAKTASKSSFSAEPISCMLRCTSLNNSSRSIAATLAPSRAAATASLSPVAPCKAACKAAGNAKFSSLWLSPSVLGSGTGSRSSPHACAAVIAVKLLTTFARWPLLLPPEGCAPPEAAITFLWQKVPSSHGDEVRDL